MIDSADFKLDARLENDCFNLGQLNSSRLLLLNNALVPWFILVPETTVTEIYDLPQHQQIALLGEINLLSSHVKQNFAVDKLNVAAIGNIVSQMHIHVVGRSVGDFCWPGVVWGAEGKQAYEATQLETIKAQLLDQLPDSFKPQQA